MKTVAAGMSDHCAHPPLASEKKQERERLILKINLNRKKKAPSTRPPLPDEFWVGIFSLLLQEDLTKEYEALKKKVKEKGKGKGKEESLMELQESSSLSKEHQQLRIQKSSPEETLEKEKSNEKLLQKYRDEQSKKKQGRVKLIALGDLPMPMKPMGMSRRRRQHLPDQKKKPAAVLKRGDRIKNFLKRRSAHRSYRVSSTLY